MKKILFIILFVLGCFQFSVVRAQILTIEITGIEEVNGDTIFIGIYDNAKTFMKVPKFAYKVPVDESKVVLEVKIPKGSYAISMFLDSNRNGVLDTGMFGIPLEKWGVSNNAEGFAGPPSFKKCRFDFNKDMTINIELK